MSITLKTINEIAEVISGNNLSRATNQKGGADTFVYQIGNLQEDLFSSDKKIVNYKKISPANQIQLETGDLVLNTAQMKAAIVQDEHDSFVINFEYAKLNLDKNWIDSKYLVYLINSSDVVKKQINNNLVGSIFATKKMSISDFRKIKFPIIDMDLQIKIGRIYYNWKKVEFLKRRNLENQNKLIMEFSKKIFGENKNE